MTRMHAEANSLRSTLPPKKEAHEPSFEPPRIETHCLACGFIGIGRIHKISESMYGSGEFFDYAECRACESLQIVEIPHDLAAYYPADYYSQAPRTEPPEPRGVKR